MNVKVSVYNNLFDVPNIELSPEIKTRADFQQYDFTLSYLLSAHDSFVSSLIKARKLVGLAKPLPYSKSLNVSGLYDLLYSLGNEKYFAFRNQATIIANNYKLQSNWVFSILTALVTNTLLVPKKLDSIYLDYSAESLPSIRFTAQVSSNEIITWLEKNRKLIDHTLKELPKKRKLKVDYATLVWGHIAWLFKKDGIDSWTKMSNMIQSKIDDSEQEQIYGREVAPSPSELQKYYTRFLLSLKNAIK